MLIPQALCSAIEDLVSSTPRKRLQEAAHALSLRYRNPKGQEGPFIKSREERLAYLCTRFPATFAVNCAVFKEIKERGFGETVHTVADLGAGSGAAFWACMESLSCVTSYTLVERDQELMRLGKDLLDRVSAPICPEWQCSDYGSQRLTQDMALFSYSLGESPRDQWEEVLQRVGETTKELIVIIEPGTPVGYEKILVMRDILLGLGWSTIAPCPHNKSCPLLGKDWCHFSQRLPRTSIHRVLKEASLGFEDEKFSYIVMGKKPYSVSGSRVIKTPYQRSGYIELELCSTDSGLLHRKTSKKEKDFFSKAKKLSWGSFYSE